MNSTKLIAPACFVALVYFSACSAVSTDVAAGRNALQTGRPNDAVGYLQRAADLDPNYKTPDRVPERVLTYLGRAYYETGNYSAARQALEQAVSMHRDDPLAHLYLGLTLLRSGAAAERGRQEIEAGLKAIDDTLDYIAADRVYGLYWDPGMAIRNDVKKTLAGMLTDEDLALAAEYIGKQFDEELDRARRDESRGRFSGCGGDVM
jgi:tetratricopeptide (TPR) repeat protein